MIELEKTYLARSLPDDLTSFPAKQIIDIYIPASNHHPNLRIRKNGNHFEITKKSPITDEDSSEQNEATIPLTEAEYLTLATIPGKRIEKMRYQYRFMERVYEIDVFLKNLAGLVLIDVEFTTSTEKAHFTPPPFCLTDVTQEDFIAGGMLCGKSYTDISSRLEAFGYLKISSTMPT